MLTSVYLSKHEKISKCSESRIMVFMLFLGLSKRAKAQKFEARFLILDVDERDDLNSDKNHKFIMKRHFYAEREFI